MRTNAKEKNFSSHIDFQPAIGSKLDGLPIAQRVFFVFGKATGM
jgi:hypothetical protein